MPVSIVYILIIFSEYVEVINDLQFFLLAMDVKLHTCMYEGVVVCMIIRVIMLILCQLYALLNTYIMKKVFSIMY